MHKNILTLGVYSKKNITIQSKKRRVVQGRIVRCQNQQNKEVLEPLAETKDLETDLWKQRQPNRQIKMEARYLNIHKLCMKDGIEPIQ